MTASLAVYLISITTSQTETVQSSALEARSSTSEPPNESQKHNGSVANAEKEAKPSDRLHEGKGNEVEPDSVQKSADPKVLRALLTGVPCSKITFWNLFTIGVNISLFLMVLNMICHGPMGYPTDNLRFSRVGYVTPTSAQVLIREPDSSELPLFLYYRPHLRSSWTFADKVYHFSESNDYTAPVKLSNLKPSTQYFYSASNNLTGTFSTAPLSHDTAAGHLTFLTSSCIKARFPYSLFSHPLSIPGFSHLSDVVSKLSSPAAFMLFLGDFIYVDVPWRLGTTAAHYRSEYRRVYASPSWSLPGLSSLPWLHTLDDHEIANDWSAGNTTPPYPAASDPFWHYHVSVNPPVPPHSVPENTTFFRFTRGPASFFMLDTRTYRTPPEPNPNATILGNHQLSALLSYLSASEPSGVRWKIIASSVPFTKNWRFGTSDTWGGFLHERSLVLDAMHAAERDFGVRVIILSGDRHEFGAVRFPQPNSTTTGDTNGPHEFSVGPLSMFYLPFRTFRQVDDEDVAIKYIPDGNSKFGVIDLDNIEGGHDGLSLLKYTLYVDGKVAWAYTLTSPGPEWKGKGSILDAVWG